MRKLKIVLCSADVLQILDALESRASSWEYTAGTLDGSGMVDLEFGVPEECHDAKEAYAIAAHFRAIAETIRKQIESKEL